MNTNKFERRSNEYRNSQGEKLDATVVRHGLLLKLEGNTVSAIEFMHNRGVPVDTIERVLSSTQAREDDKLAMLSYNPKKSDWPRFNFARKRCGTLG